MADVLQYSWEGRSYTPGSFKAQVEEAIAYFGGWPVYFATYDVGFLISKNPISGGDRIVNQEPDEEYATDGWTVDEELLGEVSQPINSYREMLQHVEAIGGGMDDLITQQYVEGEWPSGEINTFLATNKAQPLTESEIDFATKIINQLSVGYLSEFDDIDQEWSNSVRLSAVNVVDEPHEDKTDLDDYNEYPAGEQTDKQQLAPAYHHRIEGQADDIDEDERQQILYERLQREKGYQEYKKRQDAWDKPDSGIWPDANILETRGTPKPRVMTIPAGKILYHGSYDSWGSLEGKAISLTSDFEHAQAYGTGVVAFRTKIAIPAVISIPDPYDQVQMTAAKFWLQKYFNVSFERLDWTSDEQTTEAVCQAGYNGLYFREITSGGDELRLCNPSLWLEEIGPTMGPIQAVSKNSGMIAIYPSPYVAEEIKKHFRSLPNAEGKRDLHVTLVYLGKNLTEDEWEIAKEVCDHVADAHDSMWCRTQGVGVFDHDDDGRPFYCSIDGVGMNDLRADLVAALEARGIEIPKDHDFTPHMTIAYLADLDRVNLDKGSPDVRWECTEIDLVRGDKVIHTSKLGGMEKQAADPKPLIQEPGGPDAIQNFMPETKVLMDWYLQQGAEPMVELDQMPARPPELGEEYKHGDVSIYFWAIETGGLEPPFGEFERLSPEQAAQAVQWTNTSPHIMVELYLTNAPGPREGTPDIGLVFQRGMYVNYGLGPEPNAPQERLYQEDRAGWTRGLIEYLEPLVLRRGVDWLSIFQHITQWYKGKDENSIYTEIIGNKQAGGFGLSLHEISSPGLGDGGIDNPADNHKNENTNEDVDLKLGEVEPPYSMGDGPIGTRFDDDKKYDMVKGASVGNIVRLLGLPRDVAERIRQAFPSNDFAAAKIMVAYFEYLHNVKAKDYPDEFKQMLPGFVSPNSGLNDDPRWNAVWSAFNSSGKFRESINKFNWTWDEMVENSAAYAPASKLTTQDALITFPDGFYWVWLSKDGITHEYETNIEGLRMQHCGVGSNMYSLRDPQGKPHVTIDVNDGVLSQVKGKQNTIPNVKYWSHIKDVLPEVCAQALGDIDIADNAPEFVQFLGLPLTPELEALIDSRNRDIADNLNDAWGANLPLQLPELHDSDTGEWYTAPIEEPLIEEYNQARQAAPKPLVETPGGIEEFNSWSPEMTVVRDMYLQQGHEPMVQDPDDISEEIYRKQLNVKFPEKLFYSPEEAAALPEYHRKFRPHVIKKATIYGQTWYIREWEMVTEYIGPEFTFEVDRNDNSWKVSTRFGWHVEPQGIAFDDLKAYQEEPSERDMAILDHVYKILIGIDENNQAEEFNQYDSHPLPDLNKISIGLPDSEPNENAVGSDYGRADQAIPRPHDTEQLI